MNADDADQNLIRIIRVHLRTFVATAVNLDQSQDSLLDSMYLPNRASTQKSCVLGNSPRPARAAQSDIFKFDGGAWWASKSARK